MRDNFDVTYRVMMSHRYVSVDKPDYRRKSTHYPCSDWVFL